MPRLQVGTRKRVITLRRSGYSIRSIQRRLNEEGVEVSMRSLQRLCAKFEKEHTIQDLPRKSKPRLLTADMLSTMEQSLRKDDELTARKLRTTLSEKFPDFPNVSLATIKRFNIIIVSCILVFSYDRCRKEIGWVYTQPHYCQLIREANKLKRKEWCQKQLNNNENFENVIFTGMHLRSYICVDKKVR